MCGCACSQRFIIRKCWMLLWILASSKSCEWTRNWETADPAEQWCHFTTKPTGSRPRKRWCFCLNLKSGKPLFCLRQGRPFYFSEASNCLDETHSYWGARLPYCLQIFMLISSKNTFTETRSRKTFDHIAEHTAVQLSRYTELNIMIGDHILGV